MTRRDLQQDAREQRRPWDIGKDVEQSAVLADIVPGALSRPSPRGTDRAARQRRDEAVVRPFAAHSPGAGDHRSPLGVLPPPAWRCDLHGYAGGSRTGEARRRAGRLDRGHRHHRPHDWRSRLVLSEGLRPSDSPTRSLARRYAGALPPPLKLRRDLAEAPAARRRAARVAPLAMLARTDPIAPFSGSTTDVPHGVPRPAG